MNSQQQTAAVKKYTGLKDKGAQQDEIKDLLKQDPKKYTPEEQKIILDLVFAASGTGTGSAPGGPALMVYGVNLQWEVVSHPTDLSQVLPANEVRFTGTLDECNKFITDNSGSQGPAAENKNDQQIGYVDANWNVGTEAPDFSKGGLEMKYVGTVASCNEFVTNNKPAEGSSAATTASPAAAQQEKSVVNAKLELDQFDYNDLTGANFKKYVELVGDKVFTVFDAESGEVTPVAGKLQQNEVYDFQQFRAVPVFKPRFPGMKGTPNDFNGIKLKNTIPEHTTRMSVANALEMNSQILNQHSVAGHGRYYLLKK